MYDNVITFVSKGVLLAVITGLCKLASHDELSLPYKMNLMLFLRKWSRLFS